MSKSGNTSIEILDHMDALACLVVEALLRGEDPRFYLGKFVRWRDELMSPAERAVHDPAFMAKMAERYPR